MAIKSFRCLGISLPIDGSCGCELSIKGLETSVLSEKIKHWAQLVPADDDSDSPGSDSDDEMVLAPT